MKKLFWLTGVVCWFFLSPAGVQGQVQSITTFTSIARLEKTIDSLAGNPSKERGEFLLHELYERLRDSHLIPFRLADSVLFIYYGAAESVSWAGDFNGWDPDAKSFSGRSSGSGNLWIMKQQFPADARLDYKIVINHKNWILDPGNNHHQESGFGGNSELCMPEYVVPWETVYDSTVSQGSLSGNILLESRLLGYDMNYCVYLPKNYERLTGLPVVYVLDGHEYADAQKGAMVQVLDNLIGKGIIRPVIAVFIDPREPGNPANNRRMKEYTGNPRFVKCICQELVPHIDSVYRTDGVPGSRMILGTSLGGWAAAFFGAQSPGVFGLIAIHSPAFDKEIIRQYAESPLLPLRIYMSTGVMHDTEARARDMREVLIKKGYPLKYTEVNQGHSWGNWKGLIDEPLEWFFAK
ncbi:MAG: alpha/beta hydrolase-fold protein [Bacteroidales bacterium]